MLQANLLKGKFGNNKNIIFLFVAILRNGDFLLNFFFNVTKIQGFKFCVSTLMPAEKESKLF